MPLNHLAIMAHRQYMKAQGKQVTVGALEPKKIKDLPLPTEILLKIAEYPLPTTVRMCAGYGFYSQTNHVDSFIDRETILNLRAVLNLQLTSRQLEPIARKTIQNYFDNRPETLHVAYAREWKGSRNKARLDTPIYEFISKFRTLRVEMSFNFGYFPHIPEPDFEHTVKTLSITVTRHGDSWRVLAVDVTTLLGLKKYDRRILGLARCEDAFIEAAIARVGAALMALGNHREGVDLLCTMRLDVERDWEGVPERDFGLWDMLPLSTDWARYIPAGYEPGHRDRRLAWVGTKDSKAGTDGTLRTLDVKGEERESECKGTGVDGGTRIGGGGLDDKTG
ncbi:unnamed protein product [Zymoseptoria tritici ST99CH_3D7]|uniref:Uncharacterized protein n=1 Tax=Zymoseptoria tritici (strain ST99CH_3D7) TaxID=1276538 RepID=A0A1X7RZU5_ZYMT9|nr:unnamed protein product [Zymoseptoria tritici ST99CH_3D7]